MSRRRGVASGVLNRQITIAEAIALSRPNPPEVCAECGGDRRGPRWVAASGLSWTTKDGARFCSLACAAQGEHPGAGLACGACGASLDGVRAWGDHRGVAFCSLDCATPAPEPSAVPVRIEDAWVLWNTERCSWWAPDRAGYNANLFLAGVYTEGEARRLSGDRTLAIPLGDELARELAGKRRKRRKGSRTVHDDWIGPYDGGPRLARSRGMVLALLAAGGAS